MDGLSPTKRGLPMMSKSDTGEWLNTEELSFMSKRLAEKETGERGWGLFEVLAVPGSSLSSVLQLWSRSAAGQSSLSAS